MKPRSTSKAYTLIEIMIALAVFAVLATITSTAMYHAFNTRARVNVQADKLNALQLALALIARDTSQVVERGVRGNEMHVFPAFVGKESYLEFTRSGFVNPDNTEQRSTLKRVAYSCKGGSLSRRSWETLDSPLRDVSHDKLLLTNLDECSFAYLTRSRQVLAEWHENAVQQNQKKESLPMAIQFTLTVHDWGNMSLLFMIPEALYAN